MNRPLRIMFVLGSRGEWGYIKPVIDEARQRGHEAIVCATNMTLLSSHGALVETLTAQGYEVRHRLLNSVEGGSRAAMAKSIGLLVLSVVDVLEQDRPDWVVLAGDRAEQLAAATACAYTYTPTAHIQAGERSGNIDGMARHAIGRLVHMHFASNEDAAQRLLRSGEEPWRVHMTGAPQLDEVVGSYLPSDDDASYLRLRPQGEFILGCFHSVTDDVEAALDQLRSTMEILSELPYPTVWILPNNDAGGDMIRQFILSHVGGSDSVHANLPRAQFLGLLRDCKVIVGNSSSALLEAPSLGTPAVNIGNRQRDRVQGANVINAETGSRQEIADALTRALSLEFRRTSAYAVNPYGDGSSSPRIVDVLEETPIEGRLLSKQLVY